MTAKVHLQQFLSIQVNGQVTQLGGLVTPTTLDVTGLVYDKKVLCALNTTKKLFDVTTDLADFNVLAFETDYDVIIELVTDDDNSVGERSYTFELKGSGIEGVMGPAIIFTSDSSYANYTVNFAGGTLDVIQTARCRKISGAATATVRCVAIT